MKHNFFRSLLLVLVPLCLLAQVPVTRNSTKPKAKPKTEQTAKPAPAKKKTNQVAKPSATKRTNSSGATSSVANDDTIRKEDLQAVIDSLSARPPTPLSKEEQELQAAIDLLALPPTPTSSSTSTSPSSISSSAANAKLTLNNLTANMVYVSGGTFTMGATSEQGSDAHDNEKPVHSVTLSSFYICKYEVTQALWEAVMGSNPSNWKGDDLPVECVSWYDCQTFIRKLNALTGKNFRLPTEAEWEFAARGGNNSRGYKYAGSNNIETVAWYDGNSGGKTHVVGTKSPNELGLYDMSGNVWEWCQDWYGSYSSASQTNPTGASSGSDRVLRGGDWFTIARCSRSSNRINGTPDNCGSIRGLRLVLSQL